MQSKVLLDKIYATKENESTLMIVLAECAEVVFEAGHMNNLKLIDEILRDLDVKKVKPILFMSLCRYTLRINRYLDNWFTFRDNCYKEVLEISGKEKAEIMFKGLMSSDSYIFANNMFEQHVLGLDPSLIKR